MLLCGIQDIDVRDWQSNTNYKGDYGPNHPTIVNFWKVILAVKSLTPVSAVLIIYSHANLSDCNFCTVQDE